MEFNLATTVSFAAAATCLSLAVLSAYLGQGTASRHFRSTAVAAFAASTYCVTDAILAGRMSVASTVWAGRVSLLAAAVHGAAVLAFLAAWEGRSLSRVERTVMVASLLGGALSLVPGLSVIASVQERPLAWIGVTYRDPDIGPMATPFMGLAYAEQVLAALAALRLSRRLPRAYVVAAALGLLCLITLVDWASAMHMLGLPYLVDCALALVYISVGSVVVLEAAESAAKSVELARARAALAERENLAALGQLAAVVAHEVRNPVAIIFGALAALRRAARSEEDAKLLGIVGEEAERLKQLVARLLDAVRPFQLQYAHCAIEAVVKAAISQATTGTGTSSAEVELVAAPSEEVECDEILLGQAVANLVQNALIASGRRSPVRVRAGLEPAQDPTTLCVEVTDDGEGVPAEVLPRLFTPFQTTRATGTGLGLALVKRIADAHGGTVAHEAPPEGGASFLLRVPLRAAGGDS